MPRNANGISGAIKWLGRVYHIGMGRTLWERHPHHPHKCWHKCDSKGAWKKHTHREIWKLTLSSSQISAVSPNAANRKYDEPLKSGTCKFAYVKWEREILIKSACTWHTLAGCMWGETAPMKYSPHNLCIRWWHQWLLNWWCVWSLAWDLTGVCSLQQHFVKASAHKKRIYFFIPFYGLTSVHSSRWCTHPASLV